MTLEDIFDQLTYGEMAQLYVGEGTDELEGMPKAKRPMIRHSVQLGLTALHTRFCLRRRTLKITLTEGKTTYIIAKKFDADNAASKETTKYMQGIIEPFADDFVKIERVLDDKGEELPLNEIDNADSLMTPSNHILTVPSTLESDYLTVEYRANHPPIDKYVADASPTSVEIELPLPYLEPLLYFVASRTHNPVGFQDQMHEGNNYAMKYEQACAVLESKGLGIDQFEESLLLEDRGFV